MTNNDLRVGEPRLGWLVDGDPDTPYNACLLHDTGERITLTIPWAPGRDESPHQAWFQVGTSFPKTDADADTAAVPRSLWLQDGNGVVSLVRCRDAGSTRNLTSGCGQGTLDVGFAVLGGGGDYNTIHGLRSEVPQLADWAGLNSVREDHTFGGKFIIRSVDLHLESPDPLKLSRRLNLQLQPTFRMTRHENDGSRTIHEPVQIQTLVGQARPWEDHLRAHQSVCDLMSIAAGVPIGYSAQFARRNDDPHRVLSGDKVTDRWAPVRTHVVRAADDNRSRPTFLFRLEHLGGSGFRRWETMRPGFDRALDPLVALIRRKPGHIEPDLAQAGIGLEALGYALALESGVSKTKASAEPHSRRLERVAETIPATLLPDPERWVAESCAAYNAVKHANRTLPDHLAVANSLRENILMFRLWVACRIGVDIDVLAQAVVTDPMHKPWVAID